MSDGFFQRGGLWVAGQSALMLAVAVLSLTCSNPGGDAVFAVGGLLLLSLGALCGIAGATALKRNLTPFPKPLAESRLVQSGIYGRTRHPLYVAVLCASFGWALVCQSWPGMGAALALGLFLDAKARHEERWLRVRYPDYEDYQRKVRRFIPGIY